MSTKQASIKQICSWAWHNSSGSHSRIIGVCLCGVLRVCAGLLSVWVSKLLVDVATGHAANSASTLIYLSVALASLMLFEMGLMLIVNYNTNRTEVTLRNQMRLGVYSRLLYSRIMGAERRHSADLLNRINEDVRVVVEVIARRFHEVLLMLLQLVGALALLLYLSKVLALCIAVILPIFLALSKVYIRRTRALTASIRADESRLQASMQEGLQHYPVVKTLECEQAMRSIAFAKQDDIYGLTMSRTRLSTYSRGMLRFGFIAGYLTAFLWSIWHLHVGVITFGTMTAFLQLVARIQNPMANIVHYIPSFVQAMTSIDRLTELEDIPADKTTKPVMLQAPAGVRLCNVSFAYHGTNRQVFSNFSYDFAPGSKTVIVGETGIGKSTLIKLILALFEPQEGRVEVYDGNRVVKASPDTRCNMVYVPQGNSLIEGTVRDNLLLANQDATDDDMREALHTAVADFVYDMPMGLDTQCGELGTSLSEGQAQRIAIARALLRPGSIMVLDEFNSALDRNTAATLMQRLSQARANSTILFISHRPEVSSYCTAVLNISQSN